MTNKAAIKVTNLTKSFKIPLDKGKSIKKRVLGRSSKGHRIFTPLDSVSFTVNKGDFFAIAGRNGSGKSTLLKTISGIYEPTVGKVEVNGILVPFIELGVGFNPQLTGRENVYLNAALLGFSRQETDIMYDDIVDFAELHNFMEERLQNYSSGMQVRLAFSIAIRAKGDVLLLDEVLAVGDSAFQQKCFTYFEQLKRDNKTVILVTHSMSNVERFCNRGLLLDNGKITHIGSGEEIAKAYRELFAVAGSAEEGKRTELVTPSVGIGVDEEALRVESASISQGNKEVSVVDVEAGAFSVIADIRWTNEQYEDFNIAVDIRNGQDILILSTSFGALHEKYINFYKGKLGKIEFTIDNVLGNGNYHVNISALGTSKKTGIRSKVLNYFSAVNFSVEGRKYHTTSLVYPKIDTEVTDIKLRGPH